MTRTQTIARPATAAPERWRNKWRSLHDVGGCATCGFYTPPRSTYFECCLAPFASKAEAEADAIDDVMIQIRRHGRLTDEWLGAFRQD